MRLLLTALTTALLGMTALAQQPASTALTPRALESLLNAKPQGAEAEQLAARVRTTFGAEAIARGAAPQVDELQVAWALEVPQAASAPGGPGGQGGQARQGGQAGPGGQGRQGGQGGRPPRVVSDTGGFNLTLNRIGTTNVYAATTTLSHGTAFTWHYEVADRRLGGGQLEVYTTPAEAREQPGVPKGTLKQMPKWESKIFAGTSRDWWVYVPAQYRPENPAAVMVFQDGSGPKDYIPVMFDNLIARGDMPVTVGIFIQPGTFEGNRSNRSFEYDTLSDQYVRFLLEEILPEVEKTTRLRRDGAARAISGLSSGGIAAFTAAWERPNEFSKVLSWVGSFTNIASGKTGREGGHNYEAMVRKTPKKAIRVFLQDGANDLDNNNGNWPLANQTLARSLAFAGYDYRFEYGQGFHSAAHGRAILPDSLRWLWRDWKETLK